MPKALLINPSYFGTYGSSEGGIAAPVYPVLSLASLAGAAIENGHDVEILDLSYRPYDADTIAEVIKRSKPDVVGITASTPLANQLRDISYLAKAISGDTLVVGGGAHPTALASETIQQSAVDAVAIGEADFCIASLLDGARPPDVDGLWMRSSDRQPPAACLLEDLDLLPLPAWQIYPQTCQRFISRLAARHRPVTTIEFSRGCIYKCDFCASKTTMGRGFRKKSPERCADELERLASLGFREAVLVDDIFTSDHEWAASVCEAIIQRASGVEWSCTNGIRVDAADPELFRLMRRAGCSRVYFGLESGDDDILRSFGKGGRATLDNARRAVQAARDADLEPNGFFLVGLTEDTTTTMQSTIDLARSMDLDSMKCGICVPFPGTEMFETLNLQGNIKTLDWDAYTVYNTSERIFDHPNLKWTTIIHYFRRFYRQAYFGNPRYVGRRLRYSIRTGQLLWNVWYALRFLRLLLRRRKKAASVPYAYERMWRPLDLQPGNHLSPSFIPSAKRGGGPTGRDGVVTVQLATSTPDGRRAPAPEEG